MSKVHSQGRAKNAKLDESSCPFPVPVLSKFTKTWDNANWRYFHGNVEGVGIVVNSTEDAEILQSHGSFGSLMQNKGSESFLCLCPEEAFFLSYALGCLFIHNNTKELNLLQQWELFCELKEDFPIMYAVYHHFRAKGWVPKEGLKFGTDYVLYKQGPEHYHAEYAVVVKPVEKDFKDNPSKPQKLTWDKLAGLGRLVSSVSKTLLLCNVALLAEVDSPECLKETDICVLQFSRWATPKEQEDERGIDMTF